MGAISRLFLVSGANDTEDELPMSSKTVQRMIAINALGPIYIFNELVQQHEKFQLQSVTVCSTIAAPVPRKKNLAYASAKASLESFALGCRHYLSSYNIPVQIYRFGYVATNLSFGQKLLFPVVQPDAVAQIIFKNRKKNIGLRYLPRFWFFIVLMLKSLPWSIYRKLSF